MDWFFDKFGRDRVIMDWFSRLRDDKGHVKLYEGILQRRNQGYEELNELIVDAFEAGIEFSRASKRDVRPPEKNFLWPRKKTS